MATTDSQLADAVLAGIKSRLGNAWSNLLSDAERQLLTAVAADAVALQLAAMAAPSDPATRVTLLAEKRQINAQLANVASSLASVLPGMLWGAVSDLLNAGVTLALALV